MIWILLIALFLFTFLVGVLPLYIKLKPEYNHYLLAFSGAVLIGITFLHLLGETFYDLKFKAGIFILIGFFLQLFLQKFSHGLEHGHTHHHQHTDISPIFLGLAVHAFLEGIPLGYQFTQNSTIPSLFLGIAAHKAPEVLSLMVMISTQQITKSKQFLYLIIFASLTPIAGLLASYYSIAYLATAKLLTYLVPVVIGAFIHISTTIFFESGAKHHQLNGKKLIAVALGLLVSLITIL
jgi:zinc and cadmium transporter